MNRQSVRTKLTLWNVGVLTLALVLLSFGIFSGARASLFGALDKEITNRADRMIKRVQDQRFRQPDLDVRIHLDGVQGSPNVGFSAFGVKGSVDMRQVGPGQFEGVYQVPTQPNDPTRSQFRPRLLDLQGKSYITKDAPYDLDNYKAGLMGQTNFSEVTVEGEPIRVLTRPVEKDGKLAYVLQYPQPLSETYHALHGLTMTLLTVVPLVLIIAVAGGYFLTGRSLKPVREITNTAAQVSAESLDGRLEVKGNDEFSRLSQTLNGMLDRLQSAFTGMEQAIEQQRRFTADASHELRTPLTVIKANTSLALKGERTVDDYRKTLSAVNAAADTMNRLVNDLLLLARSDGDADTLSLVPLCIKKVLIDSIACVQRPGVARITSEIADGDLEVLGDAHALTRVMINLLENSARHTPETGQIALTVRKEGSEAIIQVRDSGKGIPAEHLPHIFDRFYRVDQARARAEGGNGLGLAICKSIVERHNGTLSIASSEGVGTTVTVKIPLA